MLESFKIMDYSLLVGIHNLDLAAKERAESSGATDRTVPYFDRYDALKLHFVVGFHFNPISSKIRFGCSKVHFYLGLIFYFSIWSPADLISVTLTYFDVGTIPGGWWWDAVCSLWSGKLSVRVLEGNTKYISNTTYKSQLSIAHGANWAINKREIEHQHRHE